MTPGPKPKQRAAFFRELAQLTGAGISVTQAGKVLGQEWREASVRKAVARMDMGLAEGRTIADALGGSLTPMEHSIIQAAERGGQLAQGFRHLEEYYRLLVATAARVRISLLYPLFMLHAGVLLPALLGAVLDGGRAEAMVRALLLGLAGIWAGLGLVWLGGRWLGRLAEHSAAVDRVLGMIPLVGSARQALALARWHAVVHFNIASSQRISDGLKEAGVASRRALLESASRRAARAVEGGAELGASLLAQRTFPRDMAAALAAAEFTGTLDTETLRLSQESMTRAASTLETNTKRLCGAGYGLVVIFMAWQILKVAGLYMGMYSKFLDEL
jgi:type II secretory pathway component PulF